MKTEVESFQEFPDFDEIFSSKGRSKTIKVLALKEEMNISEIMRKAKMNHTSVENHLSFFVQIGLVQEKRFGRIRIFRFKIENPKARALQSLIKFWQN